MTETRFLKVILTEDELREQSRIMAKALGDMATAENEKKAVMSQLKARIDEQNTIARSAGEVLRNGYEYRSVECQTAFDYENDLAIITRMDTLEVVEKRKLTETERQLSINIEPITVI